MRFLLSPKWVIGHLLVLTIGITCIVLGFWQLDRLQQRRLANAVQADRYASDPVPIHDLLEGAGGDFTSLQYRRSTVTGVYRPQYEVLLRSQVRDGRAGFEIVTPLEFEDGSAVMVNRGWVPLEMDSVPVAAAPAPSGEVTIEGMVQVGQTRGPLGQRDSIDDTVISRIDLRLAGERTGFEIAPVYLEVAGQTAATELPIPAGVPDFTDEGPHLGYAIQWFSFALIGIVGYGLLIRREIRRSSPGAEREGVSASEIVDDLDVR